MNDVIGEKSPWQFAAIMWAVVVAIAVSTVWVVTS